MDGWRGGLPPVGRGCVRGRPRPDRAQHPVVGSVRVGVSGWRYKSWRRDYYPEGLTQKRELEYLSRRLDSVEVNGSFYSLQRASSYQAWRQQTPRGLRFALKGSRFISHNLKLGSARQALANFFASGMLCLGEK